MIFATYAFAEYPIPNCKRFWPFMRLQFIALIDQQGYPGIINIVPFQMKGFS
jgi:hypothetical protein